MSPTWTVSGSRRVVFIHVSRCVAPVIGAVHAPGNLSAAPGRAWPGGVLSDKRTGGPWGSARQYVGQGGRLWRPFLLLLAAVVAAPSVNGQEAEPAEDERDEECEQRRSAAAAAGRTSGAGGWWRGARCRRGGHDQLGRSRCGRRRGALNHLGRSRGDRLAARVG